MSLCSANAQFSSLAATADGSKLYFTTAHWRQDDAGTWTRYGKLFVADDAGVRLVLARQPSSGEASHPSASQTNVHDFSEVDVSGDGSRIAVSGIRGCADRVISCGKVEPLGTLMLSGGGSRQEFGGAMRLSRTGRYAVARGSNFYAGRGLALGDLETGTVTQLDAVPVQLSRTGRSVSDAGDVVFVAGWSVKLRTAAGIEEIGQTRWTAGPVIDARGTFSAWISIGTGRGPEVNAMDLTSRFASVLVTQQYSPEQLSMSDDGRTLLFLSKTQLFVLHRDTSEIRQITNEQEGIQTAVLCGDGEIAYAVTRSGRILKVHVSDATVRELVGRTPSLTSGLTGLTVADGALQFLLGSGFADETHQARPPLPTELGGVRLIVADRELPIQRVSPEQIEFQVPWDLSSRALVLDVNFGPEVGLRIETETEFRLPPVRLRAFGVAPNIPYLGGVLNVAVTAALHADFRGMVTRADPAAPGEIVHVFGRGLGRVSPEPRLGEAAPSEEPFARLVKPPKCTAAGSDVKLTYAGLAPGLVGVHQLDVEIPPTYNETYIQIDCSTSQVVALIERPVQFSLYFFTRR